MRHSAIVFVLTFLLGLVFPFAALAGGIGNGDDVDHDGVKDSVDNCVTVANGPDEGPNNQLDSDSDGRGDVCDNCSLLSNNLVGPRPNGSLQCDDDLDGYGNRCDCDLDQDGACGVADFTILGQNLFQTMNSGLRTSGLACADATDTTGSCSSTSESN